MKRLHHASVDHAATKQLRLTIRFRCIAASLSKRTMQTRRQFFPWFTPPHRRPPLPSHPLVSKQSSALAFSLLETGFLQKSGTAPTVQLAWGVARGNLSFERSPHRRAASQPPRTVVTTNAQPDMQRTAPLKRCGANHSCVKLAILRTKRRSRRASRGKLATLWMKHRATRYGGAWCGAERDTVLRSAVRCVRGRTTSKRTQKRPAPEGTGLANKPLAVC